MYLLNETEQHVHSSLRDAILLLCQTGLKFNTELSVDGLLAVTVDKQRVFLISIKETLGSNEPCGANDDTTHLCRGDGQEGVNFSSMCQSRVTSVVSNAQSLSSGYDEECAGSEIPSQCVAESVTKSDQTSRQRRQKPQHTVHRFLESSCPKASQTAVSLELLSHPDLMSDWVGSEDGEVPVHGDCEDEHCNRACENDLLSDTANQHGATAGAVATTSADPTDRTFSNGGSQKCGEVIGSLSLPAEEQEQHQAETSMNPPIPPSSNNESFANCDHVSKRSHCKRRHTVRRYLDHSASPITSSPVTSLASLNQTDRNHIPRWVNNVNGEASTVDEVRNDRCGKMNLLNSNMSDAAAHAECRDVSKTLCPSTSVKSEIVEPSSTNTDIISQLASLGHNVWPSCDPQQQVALMSQFGLSAVVSAARQSAAGSWRLFPWTPPTLPPVQCGTVCVLLLLP